MRHGRQRMQSGIGHGGLGHGLRGGRGRRGQRLFPGIGPSRGSQRTPTRVTRSRGQGCEGGVRRQLANQAARRGRRGRGHHCLRGHMGTAQFVAWDTRAWRLCA